MYFLILHHFSSNRNMSLTLSSIVTQLSSLIIFITLMATTIDETNSRPTKHHELLVSNNIRTDNASRNMASIDFGHIVKEVPYGVLYPSSIDDIKALINMANSKRTVIAARGEGHSARGQDMARNGIVINMNSLKNEIGMKIIKGPLGHSFADVGAHEKWVDVLNFTLRYGLSPVSWTDYIHLTVGGTLSNAGVSGQTFKFGPQISNVAELDVVTGKGEFVTCSAQKQPDLFYGVLGGLGQFGVITRARIRLENAPKRVKWVRILYNNFDNFAKDQEHLISIQNNPTPDYVEGALILDQGILDLSFYPQVDQPRIISLVKKSGIVYALELVKYYDDSTQHIVDEEIKTIFKGLNILPGFVFQKDVSYFEFIDRVRAEELILRSKGLWKVPHPWLNLMVPKSRMADFDKGVFKDIILKQSNLPAGLVIVYPVHRAKWDNRMSAVTPDEDIFYLIGLLHAAVGVDYRLYDNQNRQVLEFCKNARINVKDYLAEPKPFEEWKAHFGPKWAVFQGLKNRYDPNKILSPGQGIFN